MLIIVAFMFSGIVFGYLFRKWKVKYLNQIILGLVWLLLFLLGVEVGLNDNVVNQFANLGLEALMIATFATLGSVIGAWLLWRKTKPQKSKL